MRILFWILVATGLAVFFGILALGPNHFTPEQQTHIFGVVADAIMAVIAGGALFMFVYCWKTGVAMMVGYYGSSRTFSRESQPFGYWCVMLFYVCAFALFTSVAVVSGWRLFHAT